MKDRLYVISVVKLSDSQETLQVINVYMALRNLSNVLSARKGNT